MECQFIPALKGGAFLACLGKTKWVYIYPNVIYSKPDKNYRYDKFVCKYLYMDDCPMSYVYRSANDSNMHYPYDNGYNFIFVFWSINYVFYFRKYGTLGFKRNFTWKPPFFEWIPVHVSEIKKQKPKKESNCYIDYYRFFRKVA